MCRFVPAASFRPTAILLLACAVSEYDGRLAAVSQPTHLGLFCCQHVRDRFSSVLVHRTDSRPRYIAGPRERAVRADFVWHFGDGLAGLRSPLAPLYRCLSINGGTGYAARRFGS